MANRADPCTFCQSHLSVEIRSSDPGYEKGVRRVFATTRERMPFATQRAKALSARFSADTAPEPYTAIGDLVELLTTLRS